MYNNKILNSIKDPAVQQELVRRCVSKDLPFKEIDIICTPDFWADFYKDLAYRRWHPTLPRLKLIPKDDGGWRPIKYFRRQEVRERIFFMHMYLWLMKNTTGMIHPKSRAYQQGQSCHGIIDSEIKKISDALSAKKECVKVDFTKYFDRVSRADIMLAFSIVEMIHGQDVMLDVCKEYYGPAYDYYISAEPNASHVSLRDLRKSGEYLPWLDTVKLLPHQKVVHEYTSLKQGCAVAAWLANVVMYHLDLRLAELDLDFVRYCDDVLVWGNDARKGFQMIEETMKAMSSPELNMELQDRKVQWIDGNTWFTFLGFNIRGGMKSWSKKYIRQFEIDVGAIQRRSTETDIVHNMNHYLYGGEYPQLDWVARIDSDHDIRVLDEFVRDNIRAKLCNRTFIGALGCNPVFKKGCICRYFDGADRANDAKHNTEQMYEVPGYISLKCMVDNRRIGKDVSDAIARGLL